MDGFFCWMLLGEGGGKGEFPTLCRRWEGKGMGEESGGKGERREGEREGNNGRGRNKFVTRWLTLSRCLGRYVFNVYVSYET